VLTAQFENTFIVDDVGAQSFQVKCSDNTLIRSWPPPSEYFPVLSADVM
jgi:hypothetical protein